MSIVGALCAIWAICWLTFRAWQVINKPVSELIDKLALDIPPAPDLLLESISSTEVRLSLEPPDTQSSTSKHHVYLNDDKIGECKRTETGIVISHLRPSTRYTIRIFAISNSDHRTPSQSIGVQTSPPEAGDLDDAVENEVPEIRAFAPLQGQSHQSAAPPMVRESSGGQPHGKKPSLGRRPSPANGSDGVAHTNSNSPANNNGRKTGASLEQLAEQFKTIQKEMEDLDKQVVDDEVTHKAQIEAAVDERDRLRKEWKEKEEASVELKKHVANLDRENRNAQTKKNAKEKALKQKRDEGEKRQADINRWKEEVGEMIVERSRLQSETVENEKKAAVKTQEVRDQIAQLQGDSKSLDEENKVKAAELKAMEEERSSLLSGADSEEAKEFDRIEREKDREWDIKLHALQAKTQHLMQQYQQAQMQCREAEQNLSILTARRTSISAIMGPALAIDMEPVRKNSIRRNRQRSSLVSSVSSPTSGNYPITDGSISTAAGFPTASNMSPTFSGVSFGSKWGLPFPMPLDDSRTSPADIDTMTGGAPMSPRADSLLPANLLGDEEPVISSPAARNTLPFGPTSPGGTAPFGSPIENQHSYSPGSSGSHPGSLFASPRDSTSHLQEMDRRSIHSLTITSPTVPSQSTASRLTSFFTPRQRGKTLDEEPPLLGSLNKGQSQSFPRNMDHFDSLATRRRGASWVNSVANMWPRSAAGAVSESSSASQIPSSRRMWPSLFKDKPTPGSLAGLKSDLGSGYNQFGGSHDPSGFFHGGSPSPRPLSTYSAEFPRPSMDNQPFGWSIFDKTGQRNSPLGPDWSSPQPWSRSQSRRPSFQYGSTSNLSQGPQEVTDIIESPEERQRPLQAPIGTRPTSSSTSNRPSTPKLNPAAPSFKLFSSKKTEKDKGKKKDLEKIADLNPEDASPPDSRRSRDSRSVAAGEPQIEPLERTSSGTPSEGGQTGAQKPTLIQKITRKSSSSKFNIPWTNKLSSKQRGGEPLTPDEIFNEDEANASDIQLGKSIDSISSTPSKEKAAEKERERASDKDKAPRTSLSLRNFGSVMRKSKKTTDKVTSSGDLTAGETSERASETGDDELTEEDS